MLILMPSLNLVFRNQCNQWTGIVRGAYFGIICVLKIRITRFVSRKFS